MCTQKRSIQTTFNELDRFDIFVPSQVMEVEVVLELTNFTFNQCRMAEYIIIAYCINIGLQN